MDNNKETIAISYYCPLRHYCMIINVVTFILLAYIISVVYVLVYDTYSNVINICPKSLLWILCLFTVITSILNLIVCVWGNFKNKINKAAYICVISITVLNMILICNELNDVCVSNNLETTPIYIITKGWFYVMSYLTLSMFIGSGFYICYISLYEFEYIRTKSDVNIYYDPFESHSVTNLV